MAYLDKYNSNAGASPPKPPSGGSYLDKYDPPASAGGGAYLDRYDAPSPANPDLDEGHYLREAIEPYKGVIAKVGEAASYVGGGIKAGYDTLNKLAPNIIPGLSAARAVGALRGSGVGKAETAEMRAAGQSADVQEATKSGGEGVFFPELARRGAELGSALGTPRTSFGTKAKAVSRMATALPVDLLNLPSTAIAQGVDLGVSAAAGQLPVDAQGNYSPARTLVQPTQRALTVLGVDKESGIRPAAAVGAAIVGAIADPANPLTLGASRVGNLARLSDAVLAIAERDGLKIVKTVAEAKKLAPNAKGIPWGNIAKGVPVFYDETTNTLKRGSDLLKDVAASTKADSSWRVRAAGSRLNRNAKVARDAENAGALKYDINLRGEGMDIKSQAAKVAEGIAPYVRYEVGGKDIVPFAGLQKKVAQGLMDAKILTPEISLEKQLTREVGKFKNFTAAQRQEAKLRAEELVKMAPTAEELKEARNLVERFSQSQYDKATGNVVRPVMPNDRVGQLATKMMDYGKWIESIDPELSKLSPRFTKGFKEQYERYRESSTAKGGTFEGMSPEDVDRAMWRTIKSYGTPADFEKALNDYLDTGNVPTPKDGDVIPLNEVFKTEGGNRARVNIFDPSSIMGYSPRIKDSKFVDASRKIGAAIQDRIDKLTSGKLKQPGDVDEAKALQELKDNLFGLEGGDTGAISVKAAFQNQRSEAGARMTTAEMNSYIAEQIKKKAAASAAVARDPRLRKQIETFQKQMGVDFDLFDKDVIKSIYRHANQVAEVRAAKDFMNRLANNPRFTVRDSRIEELQRIVDNPDSMDAERIIAKNELDKYKSWSKVDQFGARHSETFAKGSKDIMSAGRFNPAIMRSMDALNDLVINRDSQIALQGTMAEVRNAIDKASKWYKPRRAGAFLSSLASRTRDTVEGVLRGWTVNGPDTAANTVNALGAVADPTAETKWLVTPTGERYSNKDIVEMAKERGLLGNNQIAIDAWSEDADYADLALRTWGQKAVQGLKSLDPRQIPVLKQILRLGEKGDNMNRLAAFINRLEKGDTPDIAALDAHTIYFDYNAPSPYIRRMEDALGMRAGAIHEAGNTFGLFFNFARNNYPFWIKNQFAHPARTMALKSGIEESYEEYYGEDLPQKWKAPWEIMAPVSSEVYTNEVGEPSVEKSDWSSTIAAAKPLSLLSNPASIPGALGDITDPLLRGFAEVLSGRSSRTGRKLKAAERSNFIDFETPRALAALRNWMPFYSRLEGITKSGWGASASSNPPRETGILPVLMREGLAVKSKESELSDIEQFSGQEEKADARAYEQIAAITKDPKLKQYYLDKAAEIRGPWVNAKGDPLPANVREWIANHPPAWLREYNAKNR